MTRICDYEGSQYRTEFWQNQNRTYEDAVERVALQKLLPPQGERLIEIGAGFGRLVDLYEGYKQIVLLDYARTQLEEAQNYLGDDERIIYVVADVYNLPFVDDLFDALTMIRVMHHLTSVPDALTEIHRIMMSNGTVVIEHANKLHLKSLLRWLLRRQVWNPFDYSPLEFVELNFNFHPAWMRQQFNATGLQVLNTRAVSSFRIGFLKRFVSTSLLASLDSWVQPAGSWWQFSPSLFLQAQPQKSDGAAAGFFRCPNCKSSELTPKKSVTADGDLLLCQNCHYGWSFREGIYDFKTPIQ